MTDEKIETILIRVKDLLGYFTPEGFSEDTPPEIKELLGNPLGYNAGYDPVTRGMSKKALFAIIGILSDDTEGSLSGKLDEAVDSEVPIWDQDRVDWLNSNLQRVRFVDEAIDEIGYASPFSLMRQLGVGYYAELCEVCSRFLHELGVTEEEMDEE